MNLLGRILLLYVPASERRKGLVALFESTASALGIAAPPLSGLSFDECLQRYALFTREHVEERIRSGQDLDEVRSALYSHAYRLGGEIRRRLHLTSVNDVLAAGRALYRSIGIDFQGLATGEVTIRSCYFSRFYSAEVCRIISSLDEGIAAGLSGGGKLSFSRRITEGDTCCKAVLTLEGRLR